MIHNPARCSAAPTSDDIRSSWLFCALRQPAPGVLNWQMNPIYEQTLATAPTCWVQVAIVGVLDQAGRRAQPDGPEFLGENRQVSNAGYACNKKKRWATSWLSEATPGYRAACPRSSAVFGTPK